MATLQTFGGGTTDFILDPGNDAKPLGNAPYTIIDGVTMVSATGLVDAAGTAVSQLTSDADGRFAGGAVLEGVEFYIETKGSNGVTYRFGPLVSTTALSDVAEMGPKLNTIAASAAASAFSAKTAQAAAEAAASGATAPANTAIDSHLGGDATGLAPRVVAAEGRLAFDITKIRPTFLASLPLARMASMQQIIKEPTTGQFYVTQNLTGTQAGRETVTISRVSADARQLLDSMTLEDAGHGTTFGLEVVNGAVHIWICYAAPTAAGVTNDLVRFPYAANTTGAPVRRADSIFTVMPRFGSDYITVAVDVAADWIVYRDTTSGATSGAVVETYKRRKLSEVKAGVDKTYGTIVLPAGMTNGAQITMQGFTSIDGDLYRYTGSTVDPYLITRYSWATGQSTAVLSTQALGANPDGTDPDGFREPEGVSLYRDPQTGLPNLIAGVTVRPNSLAREYLSYIFAPVGADHFNGAQARALEAIAPVRKDGTARRVDTTLRTTLASVSTPGWSYMNSAECAGMTDRPTDAPTTSGYFLQNSGKDSQGDFTQRLVRISVSGGEWARVVFGDGSTSVWVKTATAADIATTQALLPTQLAGAARTVPAGTTAMHQLNAPGWYYLNTTEMTACTDRPIDAPTAAFFLHVSGTGATSVLPQIQTLYRSTIGSTPMTWYRQIDTTTATQATQWQRLTVTQVAYATTQPPNV